MKNYDKKNDSSVSELHFAVAESYKSIRTNLQFLLSQKPGCKVITVSSYKSGEGKTTNAINIAIAFSQLGKKVLLIDADLRRPTIHKKLHIENTTGLSDVLAGFSLVEECIFNVSSFLDILPSGATPPNPAEILDSSAMVSLIETLKNEYDYIIIDTPPFGIVSDPLIVAPKTNGVVVVVKQKDTRHDDFEKTVESIKLSKSRILGVVLNSTEINRRKYYSYKGRY